MTTLLNPKGIIFASTILPQGIDLLGHIKIESTVRYIGIEVDDALAMAEQVDVWTTLAEPTFPLDCHRC